MSEAAALETTPSPENPEYSEQTAPSDLAITDSNVDYTNAVPDTTQSTQALVDSGTLPELELVGLDTAGGTNGLEGLSWPDFPDLPDLPDIPPIRNPFEEPPQTVSNTLTELTPEQMRQEINDMGLASDQVSGNPPTTIYYVIGEGGKRTEVLRTDETSIEGQYAALVAERDRLIADTEQRYGVDILTSGTRDMFGQTETLRPPNLTELYVLREGLHNSQPSQLQSDKPLQFGYIKGDFDGGVLGVYNQAEPPSIILGTNKHQDYGARLLTLNHELAHSGQYNMKEGNGNYEDQLAAATGYRNVNGMWLVEGQNEGEFYRTVAPDRPYDYVRVNERGEMLRADGSVTNNLNEVNVLTAEAVRNRARVRPVTEYFPTPLENNADALAYLRSNEDRRWALIMNDPELYDATKRFDQAEIDQAYGHNADGSSKYIRGLNGNLVENNAENREEIRRWEEVYRAEAAALRHQPNQAMPTAVGHGHGGGCSCAI